MSFKNFLEELNEVKKKFKGTVEEWKKALPTHTSNVDSTKEKDVSIAYKKMNGKDYEIGRYFHNTNSGTILESSNEEVLEEGGGTLHKELANDMYNVLSKSKKFQTVTNKGDHLIIQHNYHDFKIDLIWPSSQG